MKKQPQNNTNTLNSISKKEAALELLKWLRPLRTITIMSIIIPFSIISLCYLYLDVGALAMWAISSALYGYILVRATRYQRYLEQEYNIPTKQFFKPPQQFMRR